MNGRISASAKARAASWTRRFSSVRVKSTMALSVAGRRCPEASRHGTAPRAARILDRPHHQEPVTMSTDTTFDLADAQRRQPHPGPRSLLRAHLEPRRRTPPVRHRGQGLPRLRQRHRRDRPGHAHPRVTAAIHAQVDRLIGPVSAMGFAEPVSRLAAALDATFPGSARLGHVPELRLGDDRGGAQAGPPGHRPAGDHRLPPRLPRADVRGDVGHELVAQLPDRLRAACCPAST